MGPIRVEAAALNKEVVGRPRNDLIDARSD